MTHTIKTRTGSVYEIDIDNWRFRRLSGPARTDAPDFADWTDYGALIVTAVPDVGVRLLRVQDGKMLVTSAIVEGHHELYWAAYHQSLERGEDFPGVN